VNDDADRHRSGGEGSSEAMVSVSDGGKIAEAKAI